MSFIALAPPIYYNVMQYGATGNGTSDDTAAIQAAINAAAGGVTNGTNTVGGTIVFPPGTYLHSGLVIYSFIHLLGNGIGATILQLKNGANADVIQTYNAPSLIGSGSTSGVVNWGIRHMTIDGNKANQTGTSYGIRQYGYGYTLDHVIVRNAYSDALYSEWNGTATSPSTNYDSMESFITNCKFHNAGGVGFNFNGSHDTQVSNCISYQSGSHAFHIGPNAGGVQFSQCHGWGMSTGVNAVAWLVEGQANFTNCEGEGSDVMQVVLLQNNCTWVGGRIFSGGVVSNNTSGLQIGQAAGNTPYPGSINQSGGVTTAVAVSGYFIYTLFNSCEGINGSVWFANDAGHGFLRGNTILNAGDGNTNSVATGTIHASSQVWLIPAGTVPTADGTTAKGGRVKFAVNATQAFTIGNATNDRLNLNTNSNPTRLELPNGTYVRLYSDNYSTRTVEISGGTIALAVSGSTPDPGNNGTITSGGVGVAKVTPTANETGLILQAGTNAGQQVTVINQSSSFSVTFAASSTSHVAQGTSAVIPTNGHLTFIWDSSTSLWF